MANEQMQQQPIPSSSRPERTPEEVREALARILADCAKRKAG